MAAPPSSRSPGASSVNENKFFKNVPDDLQQNLGALDELDGPHMARQSWLVRRVAGRLSEWALLQPRTKPLLLKQEGH
jgi:hypothetical protein